MYFDLILTSSIYFITIFLKTFPIKMSDNILNSNTPRIQRFELKTFPEEVFTPNHYTSMSFLRDLNGN